MRWHSCTALSFREPEPIKIASNSESDKVDLPLRRNFSRGRSSSAHWLIGVYIKFYFGVYKNKNNWKNPNVKIIDGWWKMDDGRIYTNFRIINTKFNWNSVFLKNYHMKFTGIILLSFLFLLFSKNVWACPFCNVDSAQTQNFVLFVFGFFFLSAFSFLMWGFGGKHFEKPEVSKRRILILDQQMKVRVWWILEIIHNIMRQL